jgi:uncharacterized repeat protein (TIGR03803 family)
MFGLRGKEGEMRALSITIAACACALIVPASAGSRIRTPSVLGDAHEYHERVLYAFRGGRDGSNPAAGLIADASGALYGTTQFGGHGCPGNLGCGAIFKLTPTGSGYNERILYRFRGGSDGVQPVGALVTDGSGALYGTTTAGGGSTNCTPGCGTVFKLIPHGTRYAESVIYAFQGGPSEGSGPDSTLVVDAKGALYGTTTAGGRFYNGTVFEMTPTRSGYTERILYEFRGGASDGAHPEAGVIRDAVGGLYGTTFYGGGSPGLGTVFKLTPTGAGRYRETILHFFQGTDGEWPIGGLAADGGGALYGATPSGGDVRCHLAFCGTVFKLTPTSSGHAFSVIHDFRDGKRDGANPHSGVIIGEDGAVFGATSTGFVYRLSPTASGYEERILYVFDGPPADGYLPAGLLAGPKGALFGTTENGGSCEHYYGNCGVVYELDPP